MIAITLIRKILVSLVPLAFFYLLRKSLLRKVVKGQHLPKRKSHLSGFDKSRIEEAEIVEEKK